MYPFIASGQKAHSITSTIFIGRDSHKGKEHRLILQWEESQPHYKKSMWDETNVLERNIFEKHTTSRDRIILCV